jgi:hypothetical protein
MRLLCPVAHREHSILWKHWPRKLSRPPVYIWESPGFCSLSCYLSLEKTLRLTTDHVVFYIRFPRAAYMHLKYWPSNVCNISTHCIILASRFVWPGWGSGKDKDCAGYSAGTWRWGSDKAARQPTRIVIAVTMLPHTRSYLWALCKQFTIQHWQV